MKIIIQRTISVLPYAGLEYRTLEYVRNVFRSINHRGWIENISIAMSGFSERITVSMLPQGETSPKDLVPEIRDLISQYFDLTLISIEGAKNHIKIPGLKFVSKTHEDVVTYQVDRFYAYFLASNLKSAAECTKPEVFEVCLMYEESDEPSEELTPTGRVCISSRNSLLGGQLNAYNRFAQIMMNNFDMRQSILNDMIDAIEFVVYKDGRSTLEILKSFKIDDIENRQYVDGV